MNSSAERSHQGPFDQLKELVESNDFISSDKFLQIAQSNAGLIYFKRDLLFRQGEFRDKTYKSYLSNYKKFKGMDLLVGHSDISTLRKHLCILKNLGIAKVYGTNTLSIKGFSVSLPLGLTNFTRESNLHQVFGDTSHFLVADSSNFSTKFSPRILANFSMQNNIRERTLLLKKLLLLPKPYQVSIETPNMTAGGRIDFLRKLREIPMIVCPEGNGVDTHRLWETLYMGGVPIVKDNVLLNPLLNILPVIRVRSWNQLEDLDYMHSAWERARKMQWNSKVLGAAYWDGLVTRSRS